MKISDSVAVGSTRWRSVSSTASSPVNPVPTSCNPPAGSHGSLTANSTMAISPSQNEGVA